MLSDSTHGKTSSLWIFILSFFSSNIKIDNWARVVWMWTERQQKHPPLCETPFYSPVCVFLCMLCCVVFRLEWWLWQKKKKTRVVGMPLLAVCCKEKESEGLFYFKERGRERKCYLWLVVQLANEKCETRPLIWPLRFGVFHFTIMPSVFFWEQTECVRWRWHTCEDFPKGEITKGNPVES